MKDSAKQHSRRAYTSKAEFLTEGSAPILDRLSSILRCGATPFWT
ncbi:hypothetical protein [Micromonospora craniellae]|nr:hypothetical protein [Micromonospora craniellae]